MGGEGGTMYLLSDFLDDIRIIQGNNFGTREYWEEQYSLFAQGERGPVMHDLALSLMAEYSNFEFGDRSASNPEHFDVPDRPIDGEV